MFSIHTTPHTQPQFLSKISITMSAIMNSLRPSLRAASTTARSFSTTSRRDLARMILTGRLGTEPELQATASGREVIRYVVASDYGRTQSRKTDWFRVASFPDSEGQKNFLLNLPKGYVFLFLFLFFLLCYIGKKKEVRLTGAFSLAVRLSTSRPIPVCVSTRMPRARRTRSCPLCSVSAPSRPQVERQKRN